MTPHNRKWYEIRNAADGGAEVLIYDFIGSDPWFGGGVSAKSFANDIKSLADKPITVRINSLGGDVFDGVAIYNVLRDHKGGVKVKIDGIAASIASVIAMAGESIEIAPNGFVMIHEASGVGIGPAETMEKLAAELNAISQTIANTYAARTRNKEIDAAAFRDKMKAETWLTADGAKELGLVDTIAGEESKTVTRAAACLMQRGYRNVPQCLCAPASVADTKPSGGEREPAMPCKMPDGSTDTEKDQAACEAAGGTWGEEETAADKAKAKAAPIVAAKAATLAEIKAAAPGASSEFVLDCLDKQLTGDAVRIAHAQNLVADNAKLRAELDATKKAAAGAASPVTVTVDGDGNDKAAPCVDYVKNRAAYAKCGADEKDVRAYFAAEAAGLLS